MMNEYQEVELKLRVAIYGYKKIELLHAISTNNETKQRQELDEAMTAIVQCVNRFLEDGNASI